MRFVKTREATLAPFDRAAADWMATVHTAEPITLQPVEAEGTRFRGYVFACINEMAKAMRVSPTLLRAELLLETGYYTTLGELFGKTVVSVESMSRAHMSDKDLRAFWGKASDIIRYKLLCRIDDPDLRAHLAERLLPATEEAHT